MVREGYTRSGRKLPRKTCCRCGVLLGYGAWNQSNNLDENPCEDCQPFVDRKRKAESIRMERARKRIMSKIGKRMVAHQSIARENGYEDAWTPMRYVSQEEINEMRRRIRFFYKPWPNHLVGWEACGKYIEVDRRSSWQSTTEMFIYEPGFYRVDPLPEDENRMRSIQYSVVCSGGIAEFRFELVGRDDQEKRSKGIKEYISRAIDIEQGKEEARSLLPDSRYVYLIGVHLGECAYYKIGISHSPESRCKEISTSLPSKPFIVESFWSPNARQEERELHAAYVDNHSHGEWFVFNDKALPRVLCEYKKRHKTNQKHPAAITELS